MAPWLAAVRRWLPSPTVVTAAAVGLLVLVEAVLAAARLPPTAMARITEARLADAAYAALHPVGDPPVEIALDGLATRVQLSTYAQLTGAFERGPTVVAGARELGLVACAVLLVAVAALTRSLGLRPSAAAATLGVFALAEPVLAPLVVLGPGLLGAAWLTLGAALLARSWPPVRALGVPAVAVGVASAPVLAVPVLVGGAALLVAMRLRRGPVVLGIAVPAAVFPLALLPPPLGPAAVPAFIVVALLVGLVLVDALLDVLVPLNRPGRPLRWAGVAVVVVGVLVGLLIYGPAARSTLSGSGTPGAPGLAAWTLGTTDRATSLDAPPGVWADLVRAGLPPARLESGGALVVTADPAEPAPVLARFGDGAQALAVRPAGPPGVADVAGRPTADPRAAGERLAAAENLTAPTEVRALLRSGTADPRVYTVLLALTERGAVALVDLPVVPGEDPAVPRHRVLLADVDSTTRAWLAAQPAPYAPIVVEPGDGEAGAPLDAPAPAAVGSGPTPTTLTWPLPAPTG